MHFHVPPPNADGTRPSSRSRNSYSQQLWGRSRSHSRTGMKVLADEMQRSTPRPKSPHMNNEEPISFSHYPDGQPPNGNAEDEVDQVNDGFFQKMVLTVLLFVETFFILNKDLEGGSGFLVADFMSLHLFVNINDPF